MKNKPFCIVIERPMATATCPLPQGGCVWRHRQTGLCCSNPSSGQLDIADIAALVGAPVPTVEEQAQIKDALLLAVKKEINQ